MADTQISPNAYRTHTCGQLGAQEIGESVRLSGWVHARRDHGGLIFIDLRDRWGITQLRFDPQHNEQAWSAADKLRNEDVVTASGAVVARPEDMVNEKLATGEVEVEMDELTVVSSADTPPLQIDEDTSEVNEEVRLRHRYLDLRTERMRENMLMRHRALQTLRSWYYERGFVEIETPILAKSTPEGAREYVVPSRLYPGKFYVLPQAPQQFKQLTMVAGFDKYMQIARVFRDEDQRGDRQPEFTQVDMEMSFAEQEDILAMTEESLTALVSQLRPDVTIQEKPFPRLTWHEAMATYGSDKPDVRYGLEFVDVTEECRECGFGVFAGAVEHGGVVKAMRVPEGGALSRAEVDELTEVAKSHGAGGLAWMKVTEQGCEGVPADKLGADVCNVIVTKAGAAPGDLLLFGADTFVTACTALGAVRTDIARRRSLADPGTFAFCWVTDFPMFERDEETGELAAMHHPFTRPHPDDNDKLEDDPEAVRAQAYDIALNGYEIAGGSIRIHERDLQQRVFAALGLSDAEVEERFGHLLEAFKYGVPPHGGIAWGFDRLAMLLNDEPNIREAIAFPKDGKARDLMMGSPTSIPPDELKELHIQTDVEDDEDIS